MRGPRSVLARLLIVGSIFVLPPGSDDNVFGRIYGYIAGIAMITLIWQGRNWLWHGPKKQEGWWWSLSATKQALLVILVVFVLPILIGAAVIWMNK